VDDGFIAFFAIVTLFIGLPWLVFHYITKWKQGATLTAPDEKLLDDLYEAARRMDERLCSIERIMTAEDPEWRQHCLPEGERTTPRALLEEFDELDKRSERLLSRGKKGKVQ